MAQYLLANRSAVGGGGVNVPVRISGAVWAGAGYGNWMMARADAIKHTVIVESTVQPYVIQLATGSGETWSYHDLYNKTGRTVINASDYTGRTWDYLCVTVARASTAQTDNVMVTVE